MSAAPGEAQVAEPIAPPEVGQIDPQGEDDLEQPVLLPPRGLVWVTLGALSLTAAAAILLAPAVVADDPPSLRLETWREDEREQTEMRQRITALLRQSAQAPAEERAMRGEFAVWLAQEATQGQLGVEHDFAARSHLARAEELARQLVLRHGEAALQAAAARFGLEVREALEASLRALPADRRALAHLKAAQPDSPLERVAPGMTAALIGTGIERHMAGAALEPAAQLVVEGLASQRLLGLAARLAPRPSLPSDVQALLLRWRVEAHQGLSPERRAALLAQLEAADPGYPSDFAAGVWAARAGDCASASAAWQRSLQRRQMQAQSRANLRWCQAQLRQ